MTRLRVFTACLAVAAFAASGFPLGMAEAADATCSSRAPRRSEPLEIPAQLPVGDGPVELGPFLLRHVEQEWASSPNARMLPPCPLKAI